MVGVESLPNLESKEKIRECPVARPAWVEIHLGRLEDNWRRVLEDKPPGLKICLVVKDNAYGHGAVEVVRALEPGGIDSLAVSTLDEAWELREAGCGLPILMLGERIPEELPYCIERDLTCCVNRVETIERLDRLGGRMKRSIPVHVKIDTGMSRYGARLSELNRMAAALQSSAWLRLEGLMSHFSMSDETDKSFALAQIQRFEQGLATLKEHGLPPECRHLCNSGGYLDLPQAHYDMVRVGILAYGVFPSQVCRRLPGVQPVMSVHARIAAIQDIEKGDNVGYGLRYQARSAGRIGVLPIGYGDGFPRVRNEGHVLIGGRRASIVGANAMDATMIDLSERPDVRLWDPVVVMGESGTETQTAHDVARLKKTVSYEVLTGWRSRLPRRFTR